MAVANLALLASPTRRLNNLGACASFAMPAGYDVGSGSGTVAVGDFNGDGKPDLAFGNVGHIHIVLLHKEVVTCGLAMNYPLGDSDDCRVSAAGFDGDAKPDL